MKTTNILLIIIAILLVAQVCMTATGWPRPKHHNSYGTVKKMNHAQGGVTFPLLEKIQEINRRGGVVNAVLPAGEDQYTIFYSHQK